MRGFVPSPSPPFSLWQLLRSDPRQLTYAAIVSRSWLVVLSNHQNIICFFNTMISVVFRTTK